jgi:peptidoglycan/xylan/chitin deacetylase (PgdA/CDA1 family)
VAGFAITFDDGPDPVWTPKLLDLLRELRAHATFFPIAQRAAAHPALIARILDDGHAVGLHCEAHVRHSERNIDWLRRDTEVALGRLRALGARPVFWRPPWGDTAPWSARVAQEYDLRLIGWTVDTHDWRGDSAQDMFDATHGLIEAGTIILAHDGVGPGARRDGAVETLAYVSRLAQYAQHRALTFEALA